MSGFGSGIDPVYPHDFKDGEDLPIGQVLRRITQAQTVAPDEGASVTDLQLRLAAGMQALGARSQRAPTILDVETPSREDSPFEVSVGSRSLSLQIDPRFGRALAYDSRELIPRDGWAYNLDAALLHLWVEEELAALQPDQVWKARTQARPAQLRSPAPPRQAPPAQRHVLQARREQVKQAVQAASQGSPELLARLLHGAEAAALIAQERRRAAESRAVEPPMALSGSLLQHLAAREPRLSVDAAQPAFSFQNAAQQIHANATRREQARLMGRGVAQTPGSPDRPGALASRSEASAQLATLRTARMFSLRDMELAAASARASKQTGIRPSWTADDAQSTLLRGATIAGARTPLGLVDQAALGFADQATRGFDAQALRSASPQAAARQRTPFGQTALRALEPDALSAVLGAVQGRPSRAWMMDGGRGVLLAGLDDGKLRPAGASLAALSYGVPAPAASLQSARTPGDRAGITPPLSGGAAAQGNAGATMSLALAQLLREAQRAQARQAAQPGSPGVVLTPTLTRLIGQSSAAGDLAYDGARQGSFAELLAQAQATQAQQARAATQQQHSTPGLLGLQDVTLRGHYLPALAGSLGQLDGLIARLDRVAPAALRAGGARRDATLAALERFAQRLGAQRRFGADAPDLGASAAAASDAAARISSPYEEGPGAPRGTRSYPRGWGEQSVLLAHERAASPEQSQLLPSSPEARRALLRALGAVSVNDLRSLASPSLQPPGAAATALLDGQARAALPAGPARQLQLFSPEKALALIAPQLESGGLLDATSRSELNAAIRELAARGASNTSAARRVRTPFGTLTVRTENGQLIVDAEEISSNAPSIRVAAQRSENTHTYTPTSAPSRQSARMEALLAGAPGRSSADVSFAQRAAVELTLGRPSRAERGGVEAALAQLQAFQRAEPPRSLAQVGAGADRIQLRAASPQTARLTQLLAQVGASPEATRALARTLGLPAFAPGNAASFTAGNAASLNALRTAADDATPTSDAPPLVPGSSLNTWLQRLAVIAPKASDGSLSPALRAALGEHRANALADAFADASERRVIGNLGAVAMMDTPRGSSMHRADLAYVLPFLQRQIAPGQLGAAATNARTSAALRAATAQLAAADVRASSPAARTERQDAMSLAPAALSVRDAPSLGRRLLDAGLGLGQAEQLIAATRSLGLSNDVMAALLGERSTSSALHAASGSFAAPESFAARFAPAEASRFGATSRMESGDLVQLARRDVAQRAAAQAPRLANLDRILHQLQAAAPGQPRGTAQLGDARLLTAQQPQALSGSMLRQLGNVREVLTSLSSRALGKAAQPGNLALPASLFAAPSGVLLGTRRAAAGGLGGANLAASSNDRQHFTGISGATNTPTARSGDAQQTAPNLPSGLGGLWMPEHIQRLVGMSADSFVGAGANPLSETLVVPALFGARKAAALSSGDPLSGRSPLRLSAARLEEVAHSLALGLKQLQLPQAARGRDEAPGQWVGLTSSLDRISQSTSKRSHSQRGIDKLLASLDMAPEFSAAPGQRGEGGALLHVNTGGGNGANPEGAPRAPEGSRSELLRTIMQRTQSSPSTSPSRVQGAEVAAKRELFAPFSAPQPDAADAMDMAPRASMGGSGAGASSEASSAKATAEQSNLPILDDIEETAHEVWAHIKRLIAVEFERRGVE